MTLDGGTATRTVTATTTMVGLFLCNFQVAWVLAEWLSECWSLRTQLWERILFTAIIWLTKGLKINSKIYWWVTNHTTKMFNKNASLLSRFPFQRVFFAAVGGKPAWNNRSLKQKALTFSTPLVAIFGMNLLRMVTTSGRLKGICINVSNKR